MNRRRLLSVAAGTAGLGLAERAVAADASCDIGSPGGARGVFVLVHGAFHGGWCWRDVAALLRGAGYRVFTPTLTGLGERAHLARPEVDLETHIADIVQVIDCEELCDVVLVGHSYAGYVVTGAADRRADRIRRLVHLDTYVPRPDTDFFSNVPPEQAQQVLDGMADGYLVQPFPPERFGVTPVGSEGWAWVKRRLTPHPVGTFRQPLRLGGATDALPKTYIRCTEGRPPGEDPLEQELAKTGQWRYRALPTGHDAMVSAPQALATMLIEEARPPGRSNLDVAG
jgi:pimeloyl-ACP methyl ester carboxylesterase